MASTVTWSTPTARTTGIAAEALAAGANFLGSEIDNLANRDRYCTIEADFVFATAPADDKTIECYLMYALNGTDYEVPGDASTDPTKQIVGLFTIDATTNDQIQTIHVPLLPHKFKPLLKSEADQDATITLSLQTYNEYVA